MIRTRALPILLTAAVIAACTTTETEDRYYSLVLDAAQTSSIRTAAGHDVDAGISVGLLDISLPPFLYTRAMAMQIGSNEIRLAKQHFWAEPLDEAIAKTLARDIAAAASTINVIRGVRNNQVCQIDTTFDRFHASSEGRVLVSGSYVLSSSVGSRRQEFDHSARLEQGGYASAVSALRDALTHLGREIADSVVDGDVCKTQGSEPLDRLAAL